MISRRAVSFGIVAAATTPSALLADPIIDLDWADLRPDDSPAALNPLQGLMEHDEGAPPSAQPFSTGVKTNWNGQTVRISGFIVPLDYQGAGLTAFLLVPFVGACVHVPPPPANQLVLVSTQTPYDTKGLFAPVTVTGLFSTVSLSTDVAEVGYALEADHIKEFAG